MQEKRIDIRTIIALFIGMISFLSWIIFYEHIEYVHEIDKNRMIVSWIGILLYVIFIIYWKRFNGKLFTLITIFLSFFFVFNFGQSLFWAFGVHVNGELGTRKLFGRYYSDIGIYKAQWMFIICFILFNLGAIIGSKKNQTNQDTKIKEDEIVENSTVLIVSKIMACASIPATYYIAIRNVVLSRIYSYHYLYFDDEGVGTIITIAYAMFFPTLIGLLLGSGYKKNYRLFVYSVFAGYAILALLCGDRGEWINKLLVLLWAEHTFNNRISFKKMMIYVIIALLGLNVVSAIVSVRNTGISSSNVAEALFNADNNPIISMITEFGSSMGINTITLEENVHYPYGNSYITAILTMPTSSIGRIVYGSNYIHLGKWFSKDYLMINVGTDFTIIAEAIVNFGWRLAPIIMVILGFLIIKMFDIAVESKKNINAVMIIGSMPFIIKVARSTTWYVINKIFLMYFIFGLLYLFVYSNQRKKSR